MYKTVLDSLKGVNVTRWLNENSWLNQETLGHLKKMRLPIIFLFPLDSGEPWLWEFGCFLTPFVGVLWNLSPVDFFVITAHYFFQPLLAAARKLIWSQCVGEEIKSTADTQTASLELHTSGNV